MRIFIVTLCLAVAGVPAAADVCGALTALRAQEFGEAWRLLRGDRAPMAAFLRGKMHEYGLTIEHDPARAIAEMTAAAEAGVVEAQARLGLIYETGHAGHTRIAKDYARSFHWNKLAAGNGHVDATKNLAFHYEKGFGTERDLEKAVELYRVAAAKGSLASLRNLGRILLIETGWNLAEGIAFLRTAAKANDGLAHWLLGSYFGQRQNTPSRAMARYHYRMAAELLPSPYYQEQIRARIAGLDLDEVSPEIDLQRFYTSEEPVYQVEVSNFPWDSVARTEGCEAR